MSTEQQSPRATLKSTLFIGFFAVLAVIMMIRLFDFQVVRADDLNAEAYDRRSVPQVIPGLRGAILDRNDVVLADTVLRFDIQASPANAVAGSYRRVDGENTFISREQAVQEIAEITGQNPEDILASITADESSHFAYVSRSVDLETYQQVRALGIDWLYYEIAPSRIYPNGAVAGNLVGFGGEAGLGAGVELWQNQCLAGTDGLQTVEQSGDGVPLPGSVVIEYESSPGSDIVLTIDADLQWYLEEVIKKRAQEMRADWATALVVEVSTGELMAVAEYPTVDSNNPGGSIPDTWTSRSFTSIYEPGSTMKAITVASLIDAGVISTSTQITVPDRYSWGNGVSVRDVVNHPTWRLTTAGVIMQSSNVGTSLLAEKMPNEQREAYLRAFGFGTETEVDFMGEEPGILHPASEWWGQTAHSVSYGQGIAVTSAQIAAAYQVIANDGVKMPLTLIKGCYHEDGTIEKAPVAEGQRIISERAAIATQNMLETAVNTSYLDSMVGIPNYRLGLKTATGEVADNGIYGSERVISMAGILPMDDPQYVIVVTFGHPETVRNSSGVAPAFRSIAQQVIKTFRIEPSSGNPVSLPLYW